MTTQHQYLTYLILFGTFFSLGHYSMTMHHNENYKRHKHFITFFHVSQQCYMKLRPLLICSKDVKGHRKMMVCIFYGRVLRPSWVIKYLRFSFESMLKLLFSLFTCKPHCSSFASTTALSSKQLLNESLQYIIYIYPHICNHTQ